MIIMFYKGWVEKLYITKITIINTYMIESIQLAIIQAFTALWEINFEHMMVILNFHQNIKKNYNIHHVCIKSRNLNTQMIILFNRSEKESLKSSFMEKLSNIELLQTLIAFWKTNWVYWSFANHDFKTDLIHEYYYSSSSGVENSKWPPYVLILSLREL
jgi:hypothetical protein